MLAVVINPFFFSLVSRVSTSVPNCSFSLRTRLLTCVRVTLFSLSRRCSFFLAAAAFLRAGRYLVTGHSAVSGSPASTRGFPFPTSARVLLRLLRALPSCPSLSLSFSLFVSVCLSFFCLPFASRSWLSLLSFLFPLAFLFGRRARRGC